MCQAWLGRLYWMTVRNPAVSFDFLDLSKKMSLRHHFDYRLTSLAPPCLLPLVLPSPFSFLLWPNILSLLNTPVCHTEIPKWRILFQTQFFFSRWIVFICYLNCCFFIMGSISKKKKKKVYLLDYSEYPSTENIQCTTQIYSSAFSTETHVDVNRLIHLFL